MTLDILGVVKVEEDDLKGTCLGVKEGHVRSQALSRILLPKCVPNHYKQGLNKKSQIKADFISLSLHGIVLNYTGQSSGLE